MFTGLLPCRHGCNTKNYRLGKENMTLAGILKEAGYETAAFFSNPWLSDEVTGLLRGFDVRQETDVGGLANMITGTGDQGSESSLRFISRWLGERSAEKPFLLFANFLEPHLPYDPPADYRAEYLSDLPSDDVVSIAWAHEFNSGLRAGKAVDWERVRRLYGGDVYYVDCVLGNLLSLLKRNGLYENTVVIVVSDHGENLGEHGLIEHQFSVHETLLAVPVVIRAPGRLVPGVRDDPVMLTDLFTTTLDIAGVKDVPSLPHSKSLLTPLDEIPHSAGGNGASRPVIAEYVGASSAMVAMLRRLNPKLDPRPFQRAYVTVRQGTLRLTVGNGGYLRLHDVAADPDQEKDIAKERPEDVKALLDVLRKSLAGTRPPPKGRAELDPKTRDKLRSLGYID
jgi:arylsulfatase A-like enzyme